MRRRDVPSLECSRSGTIASERGVKRAILETYDLAITKVRRLARQLRDASTRYSATTKESRLIKKSRVTYGRRSRAVAK